MPQRITVVTVTLATLLSAGCASFCRCLDRDTPNVHIAYAHQIVDVELTNSLTLRKYQIDTVCRGRFVTNDYVYVGFAKASMPTQGLPQKAILILHLSSWDQTYAEAKLFVSGADGDEFAIRKYDALQNDARKGILPDTSENRREAETLCLEKIAQTPQKDRVSEVRALEIARASLRADPDSKAGETYRFKTSRHPYGWRLYCDILNPNGSQNVGSFCTIYVGDDETIKGIDGGL